MLPLILASTSPYRRELLARLGLAFACRAPDIDESPMPGEPAEALVARLAELKVKACAREGQPELIIGSDQVACLDGEILGKPGSAERAIGQLSRCNGRSVVFHTGLCLFNSGTGRCHTLVEPFRVHFRSLSRQQIESYVAKEQPLDCAGSFRMEGLGISLFSKLEGDDPNALIGLPLIRLIDLLAAEGVVLP